jgi:nucleoside-diphosphate-sugar epimerase
MFSRVGKRSSGNLATLSMKDAALIVQNKGGGHGEIGYHLAKQLSSKGLAVTLLQDAAAKLDKPPFNDYEVLKAKHGVEVVSCKLEDPAEIKDKLAGRKFTHVFDNFAKDRATAETVAGLATAGWDVKSYAYVSSGGMYKSGAAQPMSEDTATKETGQREVEKFLAAEGLPWTSFRPQYIYGPFTNKRDYLDWFFHRIVRDRPCPLPGNGEQLLSISHVEDVAGMLSSVVGKEAAASGQVFNCGTDSFVSYRALCELVGETVGRKPKIVTYNPTDFELPKGFFPFRDETFCVSPDKAKAVLGWSKTHWIEKELDWYYDAYKTAGLDRKALTFETDDIILAKVGSPA